MLLIYKKELRHLFGSIRTYAAIAIVLTVYGFYTVFGNMTGSPELSIPFMGSFPALAIAVPMITPLCFANERNGGAQSLLYSYSITPIDTALGKYSAVLTVFAIPTALTALTPVLFSLIIEGGEIVIGKIYLAWLGYLLLGMTLAAISLFISTLSRNAWINFGIGVGVLGVLYLAQLLLAKLPGKLFPLIISKINPFHRYLDFIYGRIDLDGIVYFLTVTALFVTLTALICNYRRSNEY